MIRGYKLENIQSWSEDSPVIELSSNLPNIVVAKSETGKSVLIKMLKEMCFPGRFGYSNESLIRRGCDSGRLALLLDNGDVIIYEIYRNRHHCHKLLIKCQDASGTFDVQNFNDFDEVPEVIADRLGLLLDRASKTIINIVDKHSAIPFVSADLEGNARILSVSTENPKIEESIATLEAWTIDLKNALTYNEVILSNLYRTISLQPRVDNTLEIEDRISRKKEMLNVVKYLEAIISTYDNLEPTLNNKPEIVDFVNLDDEMNVLTVLNTTLSEVSNLEQILSNKPATLPEINLDTEVKLLNTLDIINNEFDAIESIINNKIDIASLEEPGNIKVNLEILDKLKDCYNELSKFNVLHHNKPCVLKDKNYLEDIIKLCSNKPNFESIEENYEKLQQYKQATADCAERITKLEKELGVCPICGKPF